MLLINGKLDYRQAWGLPHMVLFTGNPVKKTNNAIVMGAGAALQVRDAYLGVDIKLGALIDNTTHLAFTQLQPNQYIGWFKVKHHWRDNASLDLITESTRQLKELAMSRQDIKFHINYPGIGNGKLTREQVEPILRTLPDNVFIYI